ncbi:lipoyl synthase [Clostridium sediminicola]|uniref:lipoyl synthase n=1 Tax=Clostridium sediminicola TaxID=3114879 RepID=UPI0031F1EE79
MSSRPEWLKQKSPNAKVLQEMENIFKDLSLHTVCKSANCPNRGKCFENKTATFMILGNICTRGCRFCAVDKGCAMPLDVEEPYHVAQACKTLGLKHIVVTSVTRDDLKDGGAQHFAETVKEIRKLNPATTIELLIPDLKGNWNALKKIVEAKPDIINHNIETTPVLYSEVRPNAVYERSVELLRQVKIMDSKIYTKSGMMLGLGEVYEDVIGVMDDLIEINCDIITLGQYLRPSKEHIPIKEFVSPEKFQEFKNIALEKGFKFVASAPFVRSSYKAFEGMKELMKFKSMNNPG